MRTTIRRHIKGVIEEIFELLFTWLLIIPFSTTQNSAITHKIVSGCIGLRKQNHWFLIKLLRYRVQKHLWKNKGDHMRSTGNGENFSHIHSLLSVTTKQLAQEYFPMTQRRMRNDGIGKVMENSSYHGFFILCATSDRPVWQEGGYKNSSKISTPLLAGIIQCDNKNHLKLSAKNSLSSKIDLPPLQNTPIRDILRDYNLNSEKALWTGLVVIAEKKSSLPIPEEKQKSSLWKVL